MILSFPDVITLEEHRAIGRHVEAAAFVDGIETAGERLAPTKRNQQIARDDPARQHIADMLLAALRRHAKFLSAAYPKQLHSTLVSRYQPEMSYGWHVDEAVMGTDAAWRSDLSLTLFLSAPQDYDGGELTLDSGSGEVRVKLDARALVCYPTGQLHCVQPVTRGERLVVVAWVQSFVRDPQAREALWDLAQAREQIFASDGKSRAFDLINKTHTNLLRRWAET